MKKLKITLAGLLCALLLAACGGAPASSSIAADPSAAPSQAQPADTKPEGALPTAPDIELTDQFGNSHRLSDYRGQTVFLNFWATWCGPCQDEMPDLQALYAENGENSKDLVILGVAMPANDQNPAAGDVSPEEVAAFMEENGYSYPTLMDLTGAVFAEWGISAYPNSFIINANGEVAGYIPGSVSRQVMEAYIAEAQKTAGGSPAQAAQPEPAGDFALTSPDVADGVLGEAFGKRGQMDGGMPTLSPALDFENPPEGTVCYALIMEDPDSVPVVGYVCDHWLAANITAASLPQNASVALAGELVQGVNCFGQNAYGGPAPPNAPHTYVFTLYALDAQLPLENGFSRQQLEAALEGHVLASAKLTASYAN